MSSHHVHQSRAVIASGCHASLRRRGDCTRVGWHIACDTKSNYSFKYAVAVVAPAPYYVMINSFPGAAGSLSGRIWEGLLFSCSWNPSWRPEGDLLAAAHCRPYINNKALIYSQKNVLTLAQVGYLCLYFCRTDGVRTFTELIILILLPPLICILQLIM